jgi:hypothetical protein
MGSQVADWSMVGPALPARNAGVEGAEGSFGEYCTVVYFVPTITIGD